MSRSGRKGEPSASRPKGGSKPPMSDAMMQAVAQLFHALAEPVRLQLLQALRSGPRNVTELAEAASTSHANASKHLRVLAEAGYVTRTPEGTSTRYTLADDTTERICRVMCDRAAARAEASLRTLRGE